MEQISIYFEKFKNLGSGPGFIKESLMAAILETLGEGFRNEIDSKKIEINKSCIFLKISGPFRTEIMIRKKEIEKKFNSKLKNREIENSKKII